jgi:ubiquinone biosynthesis protein Coq4
MIETTALHTFYSQTVKNLTLETAMIEHYKINPQFTPWDKFTAPEARNLIKAHDISHLIFGCTTSYMGEYMVQTWNGFGANLNINPLSAYKYLFNKDLRQLVLPTSLFQYAITHIGEFIKVRGLIKKQAKLMTKKWEYFKEEAYMQKTIAEIRAEYNIQILP